MARFLDSPKSMNRSNLTVPTTPTTLRTRQDKPTVRIPVRTLSECAALYAAHQGCTALGLPTPDLNR